MTEQIIIVDEEDKIIEYKERTTEKQEDIYRVSALMVFNSQGQVLMAQRSFNKEYGAGKWSASAAGTVEKGETYLENILKETKEELGINLEKYNYKKIEKIRVRANHNFFCQWYLVKVDLGIDEFTIPKDEVEAIRWMDKDSLKNDLQKHPENYTSGIWSLFKVLEKHI